MNADFKKDPVNFSDGPMIRWPDDPIYLKIS
jgi:hypothetical protein